MKAACLLQTVVVAFVVVLVLTTTTEAKKRNRKRDDPESPADSPTRKRAKSKKVVATNNGHHSMYYPAQESTTSSNFRPGAGPAVAPVVEPPSKEGKRRRNREGKRLQNQEPEIEIVDSTTRKEKNQARKDRSEKKRNNKRKNRVGVSAAATLNDGQQDVDLTATEENWERDPVRSDVAKEMARREKEMNKKERKRERTRKRKMKKMRKELRKEVNGGVERTEDPDLTVNPTPSPAGDGVKMTPSGPATMQPTEQQPLQNEPVADQRKPKRRKSQKAAGAAGAAGAEVDESEALKTERRIQRLERKMQRMGGGRKNATRIPCEDYTDCDAGQCCLLRRGKRVCHVVNHPEGHHCVHDCMCSQGLQCHSRKRKQKSLNRGHCRRIEVSDVVTGVTEETGTSMGTANNDLPE